MGARSVNMLARKREEIRLSLWLEQEMRERFGSKRRAKEEILARYASVVYMGNGQYGFARAAEYYFGRRLTTFTADDADKAALLAGIAKSPRDYAPSAKDTGMVLRRRNQTLTLMRANGFMSRWRQRRKPRGAALQIVRRDKRAGAPGACRRRACPSRSSKPVTLTSAWTIFCRDGSSVYATADARVQHIVNEALEHGLERYEQRHPKARGMIQGSVVVLQNRDGRILAETGGRQALQRSLGFLQRLQPRHAVSAAARIGDEADRLSRGVSAAAALRSRRWCQTNRSACRMDEARPPKWISNYDGHFKGLIPIRQALAESRNAVAMWITEQIGIDSVLRTSRSLGVRTPLDTLSDDGSGCVRNESPGAGQCVPRRWPLASLPSRT